MPPWRFVPWSAGCLGPLGYRVQVSLVGENSKGWNAWEHRGVRELNLKTDMVKGWLVLEWVSRSHSWSHLSWTFFFFSKVRVEYGVFFSTRWWFQIFFYFFPWIFGRWSNLTFAYFSDAWLKNHQLVGLVSLIKLDFFSPPSFLGRPWFPPEPFFGSFGQMELVHFVSVCLHLGKQWNLETRLCHCNLLFFETV